MSHDPLGIFCLSSGTVSTLMRGSQHFLLYQCSDGWWIDKTQFHFWWFSKTGTWDNWRSCWQDYERLLERWDGSWTACYQGTTEVQWKGHRYSYSSVFDPTYPHWNGQDVIDEGLAKLGCVWKHVAMSDGFPPDEVIAACVGYVPVTATFDKQANPESILGYDIVNWRYVYHPDFGKPETAVPVQPVPGYVYARAWQDHQRIDDWDAEPRAKRLRRVR